MRVRGFKEIAFFQYAVKVLPVLVLPILVLFRYGYIVQSCFQYDDFVYLFDLHWMKLTDYLSASLGGHFYPLFKLEVLILYKLFGYDSHSFFVILLTVHILNSLLFYSILQKMDVHPFLAFLFSGLWGTSAVFYRGMEWHAALGALSFSTLFFLLAILLARRAFRSDSISIKYYFSALILALGPIFFISGYVYTILVFPLAWSMGYTQGLKFRSKKVLGMLFPLLPLAILTIIHLSLARTSTLLDRQIILNYFPRVLLYFTSNGWAGFLGFPEHSTLAGVLAIGTFFVGVGLSRPGKTALFRFVLLFAVILCFYTVVHIGRTTPYLILYNFNSETALKALTEYSRYQYFPSLLIAMSLALLFEQFRKILQKARSSSVSTLWLGSIFLLSAVVFWGNTLNLRASRIVMECAIADSFDQNFISRIRSNGTTQPIYFYNSEEPINGFVGKNIYPGLAAKFWVMQSPYTSRYNIRFIEPDPHVVTYWQKVFPEFGKLLITKAPKDIEIHKYF
ncbi:MAG TPA: hypothetical protein VNM22_04140 [Candidatus Limnocylindrales bacterium]|nr:hypothetical protein [Candidatus Limnocylindrales bacterium]